MVIFKEFFFIKLIIIIFICIMIIWVRLLNNEFWFFIFDKYVFGFILIFMIGLL